MPHHISMKLLGKLIINIFALLVVEYLVPGVELSNFWSATVTAVVLGMVNTFLKPILQLIALPITIMTFGIAAMLINVLLLWLVQSIVPGFTIANFTTAVIASILLSLVSWFLHNLAEEKSDQKIQ